LFISKSTVDTHRQNIIRKFKVKNTNEAIQKAVDLGFFD
jgi:DNA-binding CsgD family transcriptional regulator